MSAQISPTTNTRQPASSLNVKGSGGSTQVKHERIPFHTELQRREHQQMKRAQGWDATYEWEATDGCRDLYRITLTKLEF